MQMQKERGREMLQRCDTTSFAHYLRKVQNLINSVVTQKKWMVSLINVYTQKSDKREP